MQVMFFGYGGNSKFAEELRPTITALGMSLVTIHEWDNADIKWERSTWLGHLKKADIIIVPANWEAQPAKSNNRLTQSLALGKPVICSPLPAYLDVLEGHPGAFLVARTPGEWSDALTRLRDDQGLRESLSVKALEASKDYSADAMGKKWLAVLQDRTMVDIVIPTYKNVRGLKLCLDSIKACTDVPYRVYVVDNGESVEMYEFLSGEYKKGTLDYERIPKCAFAKAVNMGIRMGKGTHVCVLNDDVIVSRGWLGAMVEACGPGIGAVGPLSNCDRGWTHKLDINIGGVDLLPGLNTFEQIEPIVGQIYDWKSSYTEMPDREWVAYYCTLIPRTVIDKVGLLNEEYTNSGEDVDHCKRIRKAGLRIIQTYKSFVFHFGAVSRKTLEAEDPGSYQAADKSTNKHLKNLWDRPTVMVYSGSSWEKWDWKNLENGGIGGSEVWQVMICRELSKLGYRVTSFADCPGPSENDGVEWLPYTEYNRCVEQHWYDYAILSRTTDPLRLPLRAGKVFVIAHDIFLLSQREQTFIDKVTKFCCLSEWHRDFFADHHEVPKDKIVLTANGIDFDRFDSIKDVERNPHRLHWSSSLDRGLDNVLYLWPFIREKVIDAELHIYYGTLNWRKSAEQRGDKDALKKIDALEKAMTQPGVFSHGRVGQKELAMEMKKAALYLYPGWFSETFWIGGIEAQRSGVPVLANKYAGVITTIGDSGILLGNGDAWWPYSKEGREAFLLETVSLLTDKEKWNRWVETGYKNTEKRSWAHVAKQWQELFNR